MPRENPHDKLLELATSLEISGAELNHMNYTIHQLQKLFPFRVEAGRERESGLYVLVAWKESGFENLFEPMTLSAFQGYLKGVQHGAYIGIEYASKGAAKLSEDLERTRRDFAVNFLSL